MDLKIFKTYRLVWSVVKIQYQHPIKDMLILGIILLIHTLLSVAVPYILKEIVDQSKSGSTQLEIGQLFHG